MTIARADKAQNRYARICTQGLENPQLSWKSKGILAYLLSRPDGWEPYLEHLKTVSKDGRDSTASGLDELKQHGYYRYLFHRDPKTGQMTDRETIVIECPDPTSEVMPFRRKSPCSGKSDTTNNGVVNNDQKQQTAVVVGESFFEPEEEDSQARHSVNAQVQDRNPVVQVEAVAEDQHSAADFERILSEVSAAIAPQRLSRTLADLVRTKPAAVKKSLS